MGDSSSEIVEIISDISYGCAKNPIHVLDTADNQHKFPQFEYSAKPEFNSRERIPIRQFCSCVGGCSARNGCLCVNLSSVKLAKKGRIVMDQQPSENNPFNSILYQCTSKCGCGGQCQNQMVPADGQHKHHLEIFRHAKSSLGYGCRTLKHIRKGTFVCCLSGQVTSNMRSLVAPNSENLCFTFQDETRQKGFTVRMDRLANESRFFNSSCSPNLVPILVYNQWHNPERSTVAMVAMNEINPGEELTFYYGDHWLLKQLAKNAKFVCRCNAQFCAWPSTVERRPIAVDSEPRLIERVQRHLLEEDGRRKRERHEEKKAKLEGKRKSKGGAGSEEEAG